MRPAYVRFQSLPKILFLKEFPLPRLRDWSFWGSIPILMDRCGLGMAGAFNAFPFWRDRNLEATWGPLTRDRGAALARIMQADKQALEALVNEPARPKEFVIELTGDYDIIRVTKD